MIASFWLKLVWNKDIRDCHMRSLFERSNLVQNRTCDWLPTSRPQSVPDLVYCLFWQTYLSNFQGLLWNFIKMDFTCHTFKYSSALTNNYPKILKQNDETFLKNLSNCVCAVIWCAAWTAASKIKRNIIFISWSYFVCRIVLVYCIEICKHYINITLDYWFWNHLSLLKSSKCMWTLITWLILKESV